MSNKHFIISLLSHFFFLFRCVSIRYVIARFVSPFVRILVLGC